MPGGCRAIFGAMIESSVDTSIHEAKHETYGNIIAKVQDFHSQGKFIAVIREAFLQAKMRHPWVCQALDFEILQEQPMKVAIYMEKLNTNLMEEIEERKNRQQPYTEQELRSFLEGMVDVLAEAQDLVTATQRICHRDIKPQNIFVKEAGQYKLGDFGEAKVTIDVARDHSVRGTEAYMSPSLRAAYREHTPILTYSPFRSDMYSLGMTLLSMATLITFDSHSAVNARDLVPVLQYSDELKQVMLRMLDPDESVRPDFLTLKADLVRWNPPFQVELKELVDKLARQICLSTEEMSRLAVHLQEVWNCAFFNNLNLQAYDRQTPQFFMSKLQLSENFPLLPMYPLMAKVTSHPFEYIPISELIGNSDATSPKSLVVKRKEQASQDTEVGRIRSHQGVLYSSIPSFIVRKRFETITVSEPATSRPAAMLRLLPRKDYLITEGQFYQMGPFGLEIVSVSESRISLCEMTNWGNRQPITFTIPEIFIGNSSNNTLQMETRVISNTQAVIRCVQGRWIIQDLRSKNGTWLYIHTANSLTRESNEMKVELGQKLICGRDALFEFSLAVE